MSEIEVSRRLVVHEFYRCASERNLSVHDDVCPIDDVKGFSGVVICDEHT